MKCLANWVKALPESILIANGDGWEVESVIVVYHDVDGHRVGEVVERAVDYLVEKNHHSKK